MKTEQKAQQITEKIKGITADKSQVIAYFNIHDESVQAELRLHSGWGFVVPVDNIHYPKRLSTAPVARSYCSDGRKLDNDGNIIIDPAGELWDKMHRIEAAITPIVNMPRGFEQLHIPISIKTKTGPERRTEAKNQFIIAAGQAFLADYRAATKKSNLAKIRKQITALQAEQKALLPKLRESNSAYLAGKKTERETQAAKNAEALKSGRFWEADADTLKGYFHPPFDKNYVADISEKWRACLILECESISWKNYNGEWRHKLGGTGTGYLCGIDDNGDEWGFEVSGLPQSHDNYGNAALDTTVEEAMSRVFGIRPSDLAKCTRQGDLLFCPETVPDGTQMESADEWTPRESHTITSPTLYRNGRYFWASDDITVSHTSHHAVVLQPGPYRLYMSRMADPVD